MNNQRPRARHSVRESPSTHTSAVPPVPPDDDLARTTIFGATYLHVRHTYPDATPREVEWALAMAPGETWFSDAKRGVKRLGALRDARRREPNLSDDAWWAYIGDATPRLSELERQTASKILAAVRRKMDIDVEVLKRARHADEPEWHGLTERAIREAAQVERRGAWAGPPEQPRVAERLGVSVSKLRRAMDHFDMGHWPPGPPRD